MSDRPKREASEYITKEHGSTPNPSAVDNKPSMATAAQMAKRKMATPRSRLGGRANTPTAPSSNPFASNQQPQQQQTFGAVGDVTFGASQSFPPGVATPEGGFTFTAGQQDSNPFANANPSNPFASVNGSNPFGNTNGTFGGNNAGSSKRNSDDMMTESPEKKTGSSPFGRNANFNFVAPQPQQPSGGLFGFGAAQNQNNNQSSGGLFGGVTKPDQPQQNNLFGQKQSAQPSFASFGQKAQSTSQAPSFSFGQNQQKEQTPTPPPSFGASFGQKTSTQQSEPPKFTFGQPASAQASQAPSLFGQTSTTQQTQAPSSGSSESSRSSSPFKLGDSSAGTSSTNPFAGIQAPAPASNFKFGQTETESTAEKPEEPKSTTSLFGQATTLQPSTAFFGQSTSSKPPSNLFGQTASPAKSGQTFMFDQPPQTPQSSTSEEKPAEAPKNPFGSLFNAGANTQPPAEPPTTAAEPPKSGPFNFGAPPTPSLGAFGTSTNAPATTSTSNLFGIPKTSQPASNLFNFGGPNKEPEALKETTDAPISSTSPEKSNEEATPSNSSFGFGSAQLPSSGGLFTPAKPAITDKAPATEPSKVPAFGSASPLFQKDTAQNTEPPATEKPKKPMFGRTLDSSSTLSQPAAPELAVKALLFGAQPVTDTSISTEKPVSSSSSLTAPPAPRPATKSLSSTAAQPSSTGPPPKRPIYTKSPARIPNFLNGEGYKEFDSNYRLRALNREFQRRVAALDPSRQDFENLIRHYVAARASIGADIGLYQRTMAGTKRKNDTIDDEELEVPPQYKKSKADDGQPASTSKTNTFGTAGPATSIQPNTTTSTPAASSSTPSKATSMFNSMIPKSPQKTSNPPRPVSPDKPVSVFASVPGSPASNNLFSSLIKEIDSPAPEVPSFGQPAPSTTPAKPPPKFLSGMPGVAAGNAFAAFGNAAAKGEKKRKAERLEDEYDSDEDSQAEGRKKLEEEDRAKRARYDAVPKTGFIPTFGIKPSTEKSTSPSKLSPSKALKMGPFETDSDEEEDDEDDHADDEETTEEKDGDFIPSEEASTDDSQGDEEVEDDLPEDEVEEDADEDDVDHQAEIEANPNKGKSLFDRIKRPDGKDETPLNGDKGEYKSVDSGFKFRNSTNPIMGSAPKNSAFKPSIWGAHIGKSTPEAPGFSPLTPATSSTYKPATTFTFTATPPTTTPTPTPGASVLAGGSTSSSYAKFDGMFGSRPSTPNPLEREAPAPTSAPADHTWKVGSPIKFGAGTPETGPKISLTEASPGKDAENTPRPQFGSLFGTTPASTEKPADTNLGFSFAASKPIPGFLNASDHLKPGSVASSGFSSRATSPGLTDNESVATNETDEVADDPQTSLVDSRAGEENEDCLFEARSKALKFLNEEAATQMKKMPNTWATLGVGIVRLLKNKDTGQCRIVFRVEPAGNVIVNANLIPNMEYTSVEQGKSGAVKGPLYNAEKKRLERWVFKLRTKEMAEELQTLLVENRGTKE